MRERGREAGGRCLDVLLDIFDHIQRHFVGLVTGRKERGGGKENRAKEGRTKGRKLKKGK
jgi:hypothetical protein